MIASPVIAVGIEAQRHPQEDRKKGTKAQNNTDNDVARSRPLDQSIPYSYTPANAIVSPLAGVWESSALETTVDLTTRDTKNGVDTLLRWRSFLKKTVAERLRRKCAFNPF